MYDRKASVRGIVAFHPLLEAYMRYCNVAILKEHILHKILERCATFIFPATALLNLIAAPESTLPICALRI
jgi:hypothetical protein